MGYGQPENQAIFHYPTAAWVSRIQPESTKSHPKYGHKGPRAYQHTKNLIQFVLAVPVHRQPSPGTGALLPLPFPTSQPLGTCI